MIVKYKPKTAHADDNSFERLPVTSVTDDRLKGKIIIIKKVRRKRILLGFTFFEVIGDEYYYKPYREVVNKETQRFIDYGAFDKESPFINNWWRLESLFTDFHENQHEIRIMSKVVAKNPLFSILNHFSNSYKIKYHEYYRKTNR